MFLHVPEQVRDHFAECSTPAGCVAVSDRPKKIALPRPFRTPGGIVVAVREIGSNVWRIKRRLNPPKQTGRGAA